MLIIQGKEDKIIPVTMADDLFVPKLEPREMVIISQAGHTNVHEVEDQHYFFSLNKFIQSNSPTTDSGK